MWTENRLDKSEKRMAVEKLGKASLMSLTLW
jgi:hypothetical protein